MSTKTTLSIHRFNFILITLLTSLTIHHANANDKEQYGYMGNHMGMGHMNYGPMGNRHMNMGPMSYAHMGMGPMGYGHMGMMGNNYMHMLNLSESQRKSIRNIQKETRTQHLSLHDKLTESADKLYSLYKADKPDAKKIGSIYKNIFDVKRQQIELSITTKNKTYDILTKEQKETLKEWKASGMGYGRFRNQQGRGMRHMME